MLTLHRPPPPRPTSFVWWAVVVALVVASCSSGGADANVITDSIVRVRGLVCRTDLTAGGVFIGESHVLTVAHAVAGEVDGVIVETADGAEGRGVVVAFDPERDLAVVAVEGVDGSAAALADAAPGDDGVIWWLDGDLALRRTQYVVERIITATGDDIYGAGDATRRALQLSADIETGVSGSPVADADGRILGIVFAESRNDPVAYAVTSGEVLAFLDESDLGVPVEPGRCRFDLGEGG